MALRWNSPPWKGLDTVQMVSSAYLLRQAEILIAMSRSTLDLGVARRLREMASEFQARAAQQDENRGPSRSEEGRSV
jgi:hypothetical protein